MVKNLLAWLALPAFAAAAGVLAWWGPFWLLPASLVAPVCSTWASSRLQAWAVGCGYMAGASFDLTKGAATYFDAPILGVILWLSASVIVGVGWGVVWHGKKAWRLMLLPIGFLITAIPPIGIVAWSHPFVAAGCLFPGWGWAGLGALLGFAVILAAMPRVWAVAGLGCALIVSFAQQKDVRKLPGWVAKETHFDCGAVRDFQRDFRRIKQVKAEAETETADVVIYGESLGGLWTKTTAGFWEDYRGAKLLVGSEVPVAGEYGRYDNGLVLIPGDGTAATVIYRQRMPIPVSMWRPWTKEAGCRAYWTKDAVVKIGETRVGVLICYESVLVWPVMHTITERPEALIVTANNWWARDTKIPAIMSHTVRSWAILFDLPLIEARNL